MLLELLSDFQITIPELGTDRGAHAPGRAADLEQLARADRGAQAPLPVPVARLPGRRPRAGDRPPAHARAATRRSPASSSRSSREVRELDLKKPPSIAESIDWARALLLRGADDIDQKTFRETMSVIVKHRTDLDTGRRASSASAAGGRSAGAVACSGQPRSSFGDELRREGVAIGTSSCYDAFAGARARSAGPCPSRLPRGAGGDAGQVARRPPRLRPRVRALSSSAPPRRRSCRPGIREADAPRRAAQAATATEIDYDALREQIPQAIARTATRSALRDLARLAIAAFGARGPGLRGARRRRAAHPPRARA